MILMHGALAAGEQAAAIPAKDVYLFRHSLLRSAAYQGQLPAHRAALHALAFEIVQSQFARDLRPYYYQLAEHARFAQHPDDANSETYKAEELKYLRLAAERARAAYRNSEAARHYERIAEMSVGAKAAEALITAGNLRRHIGDVRRAHEHYELSLEFARKAGDLRLQADALDANGSQLAGEGAHEQARTQLVQALGIRRSADDRAGEARTIWNLAYLCYRLGDFDEAEQHWKQSLAIAIEMDDFVLQAESVGPLGNIYRAKDQLHQARAHYARARELHTRTGNRISEGISLGNLGIVDHLTGRLTEAMTNYCAALEIHREVGNKRYIGRILCDLGYLELCKGETASAEEHLLEALAIACAVEDRHDEALVHGYLGELYFHQGRRSEAQTRYDDAIDLADRAGNVRAKALFIAARGVLDASKGRVESALQAFDLAGQLFERAAASACIRALEVQRGHADLALYRREKEPRHLDAARRRLELAQSELTTGEAAAVQSTYLVERSAQLLGKEILQHEREAAKQ